MTPVSLNGVFDNENINRVVYPASKKVDFAGIEQRSHCHINDEVGLEKPADTLGSNGRNGHMLQLPSGRHVLPNQRETEEGHDGATEQREYP